MKGSARPQAEKKEAIKLYTKSGLATREVAKQLNLPESTVYNWIKPFARHRAKLRLSSIEETYLAVSRARAKAFNGYDIRDALLLEDVAISTYYRYRNLFPFKTRKELLEDKLSEAMKLNSDPKVAKCLSQLRSLIKCKPQKTFLKKPTD